MATAQLPAMVLLLVVLVSAASGADLSSDRAALLALRSAVGGAHPLLEHHRQQPMQLGRRPLRRQPRHCPPPRRRLRNRVKILEEKERNLELQLLEYYGIKEQETAVIELQNRLRLNTVEAKLYNLKIESLLLDNRRLEAQAADHANASAELEAAKGKIKMLRKKLKSDAD